MCDVCHGKTRTTWREQFEVESNAREDATFVVGVAPNTEVLDVEFDHTVDRIEGPPVLIWTVQRVYFPVARRGWESLGSVPRTPQADPQEHFGTEG